MQGTVLVRVEGAVLLRVYGGGNTHSAGEVALDKPFCVQLRPETLAELHQVGDSQALHDDLVLLHHGPARLFQDQQPDISAIPQPRRCTAGNKQW